MRFHRLLCLLLCLLLPFAALAEPTEETLIQLAQEKVQTELDRLRNEADGWSRVMLSDAQISEVELLKGSITVHLTVPRLKNALSAEDAAAEAAAPEVYLTQALADYCSHDSREPLKLNFTYRESDGGFATKWSGNSNPRKLVSSLARLAGQAKKSYQGQDFRNALESFLLPRAAQLPQRQPETLPALTSLERYAAQVAPTLGLTTRQAEGRLRCLLLMMELTELDVSQSMEQAVLTLKVDDWVEMLAQAEPLAQTRMEKAVGVPEMSPEEVEAFLWEALPEAMLPLLYDRKGAETIRLTVDVPDAIAQGPQQAKELMDFFAAFNVQVGETVERLQAYAASLPYYPPAEQRPSGVLTGEEDSDGVRVTFDMGSDSAQAGCVKIRRGGSVVLTGYIRQQIPLTVRLAPGAYTVDYAAGAEWYGQTHLFGKETVYGRFQITVPASDRLEVTLQPGSGETAVLPLTPDEFAAGLVHES